MLLPQRDLGFYLRHWLVPGDAIRSSAVLETMRQTNIVMAEESEGPIEGPVLVLAPHPDDEVIGPGGTLISLLQRGVRVTVAFLTDGTNDPNAAAIRREEATASAEALGFQPRFLGLQADAIPLSEGAAQLQRLLAEIRPAALMLPFVLDDNDDHRRTSELLLRIPDLPPELPIWAYQVYTALPANRAVNITRVADAKAKAIGRHASQMKRRDWAHYALGINAVNIRLLPKQGVRYVEAFLALPAARYVALCESYFGPDAQPCYLGSRYRSMART